MSGFVVGISLFRSLPPFARPNFSHTPLPHSSFFVRVLTPQQSEESAQRIAEVEAARAADVAAVEEELRRLSDEWRRQKALAETIISQVGLTLS